ncbi:MAG: hypothetical protein AB7G06_05590 [Bdellovibrionales bacterium]
MTFYNTRRVAGIFIDAQNCETQDAPHVARAQQELSALFENNKVAQMFVGIHWPFLRSHANGDLNKVRGVVPARQPSFTIPNLATLYGKGGPDATTNPRFVKDVKKFGAAVISGSDALECVLTNAIKLKNEPFRLDVYVVREAIHSALESSVVEQAFADAGVKLVSSKDITVENGAVYIKAPVMPPPVSRVRRIKDRPFIR